MNLISRRQCLLVITVDRIIVSTTIMIPDRMLVIITATTVIIIIIIGVGAVVEVGIIEEAIAINALSRRSNSSRKHLLSLDPSLPRVSSCGLGLKAWLRLRMASMVSHLDVSKR